jgi:hypothetical protein
LRRWRRGHYRKHPTVTELLVAELAGALDDILRLRAIIHRAHLRAEAGREDGVARTYRHAARYILGTTKEIPRDATD